MTANARWRFNLSASTVLALVTIAAACGGPRNVIPPGTTEPDKYLFERGTAELMKENWLPAREYFLHDQRRLIRALEVYRVTGQPISHLQLQFEEGRPASERRVFVLQWPRAELHRRINERVARMFAAGLVEEVQGLLAKYGALGRTASQAVGYREAIEHLNGKMDLEETIRRVQARTRQFARRQETWFRSLSECRFAPMQEGFDPQVIARRIVEQAEA